MLDVDAGVEMGRIEASTERSGRMVIDSVMMRAMRL